ncbi:surface antigen BspA-like [Trichomonas vaginalis G3]|uniref:Surface antigen BspA-like n=1 Tax=Trichomonas vaginalis (strain ATCC PRA-98 / G3) TaxID=412133 RepID=A2F240_TRIV3|nr:antigen BSP-related family [Trichomonas vaginalis G3]EAY01039.1 surface antigen BspA-like [Trichomonas vaginalis G3]KAI5488634.1 antigen BSP-related family [Trichomonas vaginalis G3]|eukprot:XP_001330077.1 surface antigen BspA-like [Trichomonas vaginalis G3]
MKSGPVIIPEGIVEIGYASLSACLITSITLPTTLKTIYEFGLQAILITEIDIPDSVTSIKYSAMQGCTQLKRVKLPSSIVELGGGAFKNTGLASIELPDSLKIINSECFVNCPNLKVVVLPENLKELNGKVFDTTTRLEFKQNSNFYVNEYYIIMTKDNQTLIQYIGGNEAKEIPISSEVIEIKSFAFQNKNLLTKIIFETNSRLQTIQGNAFSGCENAQFIELPTKLTTISDNAFLNCKNLESITLSSCTSLGTHAFENCIKLKSISMEDSSLTSFGESAFAGCTLLTNIKLPRSLTSIGNSAFAGCTSLTKVLYHNMIASLGNNCFNRCNQEIVDLSSCTNLTSISEFCFIDNPNLVEIKLPSSIKIINSYSFSNTGITTFTCPLSLETIYSDSFLSCAFLSSIIIPTGCKLSSIGVGSFRNCFNIRNITCSNSNYKVVTGALFDISMTTLILFPPASPVKYFALPGSTMNIGKGAFMSCINLITITIPSDSVQRISQNAFEGCRNLKLINIPKCVLSVGRDAFKDCDQLSCGCEIENRSKLFISELIKRFIRIDK